MKLYYFDAPGRAEAIRLLLFHAGVKFEDVRFKPEDWSKHKDEFELKQLPVLEDHGKKYCQSYAILEYLGSKYGYLPKKYAKVYQVLYIMNTAEDCFMRAYMVMSPKSPYDEKTKAECMAKFMDVEAPLFLGAIEKRLKENCSQDFMVGCDYTIADFYLIGFYQHLMQNEEWKKTFAGKLAEKFPLLAAYAEKRMKDFNLYYKKCQTKLYYFDIPGRAEMIRVALRHLKVPFEDVRIKFEDWQKMKLSGKFELQQLPVMECEPCGTYQSQSDAIMHRLGARFGLLGMEDPEKFYNVLWWCNTLKDLMETAARRHLPIAADKQKQYYDEFFSKTVHVFMGAMEARLKANESHDFLVGKDYTIADFYMVGTWRAVMLNPAFPQYKDIIPKYPLLKEYMDKKAHM